MLFGGGGRNCFISVYIVIFCLFFVGGTPICFKSSIAPQLVLFLHISSSWVKIRLHIKNQLPRLSESSLIQKNIFFDGTPIICLHISSTWFKIGCLEWSKSSWWVVAGWAYPVSRWKYSRRLEIGRSWLG